METEKEQVQEEQPAEGTPHREGYPARGLTKEAYRRLRRMNKEELSNFFANVYHSGYMDGLRAR